MRETVEGKEKKKMEQLTTQQPHVMVLVCDNVCISLACQKPYQIIDLGDSFHITPYREMFISNVDGMFGGVKMANHGMF